MGFDRNQFYTLIKAELEQKAACTVGQYQTPKEAQLPYVEFAVTERVGGNYDLEGREGSETVTVVLEAWCQGSNADNDCEALSETAKESMLSHGFLCIAGPKKQTEGDDGANIARWAATYQRIIADGDTL